MYNYENEKKDLFTESGQVIFLKIRDKVKLFLDTSGSFRIKEVINGCSGSSWKMLACIDRLVELGEIREVTSGEDVAAQNRVFVKF